MFDDIVKKKEDVIRKTFEDLIKLSERELNELLQKYKGQGPF